MPWSGLSAARSSWRCAMSLVVLYFTVAVHALTVTAARAMTINNARSTAAQEGQRAASARTQRCKHKISSKRINEPLLKSSVTASIALVARLIATQRNSSQHKHTNEQQDLRQERQLQLKYSQVRRWRRLRTPASAATTRRGTWTAGSVAATARMF